MKILINSFKETILSVTPVVVIVLILSILFVDVSSSMLWSFLLGSLSIIIGLGIFLYGIETGMKPVGQKFGNMVVESKSRWLIGLISFIIGFTVTIAEPDLLILGQQIDQATGGLLNASAVVVAVSIGVGLMIALGVSRLLRNFPISKFFLSIYIVILILGFFADEATIAMAFDASGATTGALTTPFVLVLSASISARKGGASSKENSFGLVGAMSTGPILAVFLLILLGQSELQAAGDTYQYTKTIFGPILAAISPTFLESFMALLPVIALFLFMNWKTFKTETNELIAIFKGFGYTIIGLALFLIGVNEGFMDMGHFLGSEMASFGTPWLFMVGSILGLVVVLAEPAVQVLGNQVSEISDGDIQKPFLMGALSLGVGIAVGLSMLRIAYHSFEVWHILLPGFILAIALSFYVPPIFTGIAFDAGGVASGPMAVTFILAFAQGAASYLPGANALDAFGVIAFIALTPIITVQILGVIYKQHQNKINHL